MKKIIYTIAAITMALGLGSCEDFLEKTPYDRVDPQSDVTDEVCVAMANACYVPLRSSNLYNQRIWGLDIVAGNSNVGAGGGDDGIETIQCANFTTLTDNGMALYMWRSPWIGIAQCNNLLKALDSENQVSQEIADRSRGEALFLRSHYYYLLVRLYGGVPLRLEPYDPGTSSAIARVSAEEVYEQIIKDLDEAIELLPAKADYADDQKGRACLDAALYELADVYLTLAPSNPALYAEVVNLCNEITALGYNLANCPFQDNFNCPVRNGAESIFEVQYSGSTEQDFWGNTPYCSWLSCFMGPRGSNLVAGSYGWNQPTQEFMNQWEDGDLRKPITVFYEGCPQWEGQDYRTSWSNTGYNVRKFLVSKEISPETNTSPANFIVYRYAGALLMQAEALNETQGPGAAAAPINEVRRRAGLPILSGLSKAQMKEAIIHERRMELAFEGHRWFDMIRVDNGQYALDFLHSIGKSNATKERLLFPIPQTEMDANPLMTQNPGY